MTCNRIINYKRCAIKPIFTQFCQYGLVPSGACGRERTIGAIMHGEARNIRRPIKESHDFRPSWQARLGKHSWYDTEDECVTRLKPRHESAKTPFRNDLLARGLLSNQLRYRQLRPHRPVKRVETETVITHVAIGRVQRQNQDKLKDGQKMGKSTCAIVRSVGNITGSFQCRLCTRPSPVTGTGLSNTCVDRWRGQAQMNFRKPIKESHDFRPSWQARLVTHSR